MFPEVNINWWAVLVAIALNMILGTLWYGPLFGKPWMRGLGLDLDPNMKPTPEMKRAMMKSMGIMVVTSFLMCWVMAYMIDYTLSASWREGLQTGFWMWVGFQLTFIVQTVLFERKNKTVATINAAYQLIALAATGALLAGWR